MVFPELLTKDPDGTIHLTDHRIAIEHILFYFKRGWTTDQIVEYYPSLSNEKVDGVVDFYQRNQNEVDHYLAEVEATLERQERESRQKGPTFEELKARMRAKYPDWGK